MKTLVIVFERIFHFMCMHFFVLDVVCMPHTLFALSRLHRDHRRTWTWSYRQLLSAMWRLGIDTMPSLRLAYVLNHKLSPPNCLSINMISIFLLRSFSFSSHIVVCFLEDVSRVLLQDKPRNSPTLLSANSKYVTQNVPPWSSKMVLVFTRHTGYVQFTHNILFIKSDF